MDQVKYTCTEVGSSVGHRKDFRTRQRVGVQEGCLQWEMSSQTPTPKLLCY